jgi:8-oxo-dGTP diphosphatase
MDEHQPDSRPPIAAAVIVNDGRLLLVRRRQAEGNLLWQFPAGEVEPGETIVGAALRETTEETGLTVYSTGYLGERIHPQTGRRMGYVLCEVLAGSAHVADADELDAIEWCDADQVAVYVPWPFYPPVQAYLDSTLSRAGAPVTSG